MKKVERGKPREWETQILVGEPNRGESEFSMGLFYTIDKCLSPYIGTEHGL